jgi:hypothetical protein
MAGGATISMALTMLIREMYEGELGRLQKVVNNDEGIILAQTMMRILTQIVIRCPE